MSVVTRIDPNSPIRNGGATVATGGGTQTYCRDEVTSVASGDLLNVFQVLDARYLSGPWAGNPFPITAGDTTTASGTPASINYPAPGTSRLHVLYGIGWGYSGTPSGGYVSVESPSGTAIWGPLPVTASGPGNVDFDPPLRLPTNQAMRVVVGAGAGTVASLSITGRRVE